MALYVSAKTPVHSTRACLDRSSSSHFIICMAHPSPRVHHFPGNPSLALVRSPSSSTSSVVDVLFPVASRVVVHPLIDQGCVVYLAK